jgi:hypothetical protein
MSIKIFFVKTERTPHTYREVAPGDLDLEKYQKTPSEKSDIDLSPSQETKEKPEKSPKLSTENVNNQNIENNIFFI